MPLLQKHRLSNSRIIKTLVSELQSCLAALFIIKQGQSLTKNPCSSDGADDGIEEIVAAGMVLKCLQTRTGIKFVITATPGTPDMDIVLKEIYLLYAECVLKDPFYELEMPIRSDLFTQAVDSLVEKMDRLAATKR